MGRVSHVCTLTPNFTAVALKILGLTAPKIAKIGNFWYIFSQKGYIPLSNFYKIWHGGGAPRSPQSRQLSLCGFINVALWPPKSPKIAFFGLKFAPKKKSRGP